ncbi:MAG: glyceraldehyde 3-phosphate dehydrogenase NAD-binding domain-containing protein, partial [Oscillospiraceae bacterium]
MSVKIGINGFGRIGRAVLRQAVQMPEIFEICCINYRNVDLDYMVYMTKYDSVFGRFNGTVEKYDKGIVIDGIKIPVLDNAVASAIPWGEYGAEYIIESTGAYTNAEKAKDHFVCGAKK